MKKLDSAAVIKEVREKSGLSQEELAQRAGTSQPAVARYEAGVVHPSTATLERLVRAAGYEVHVKLIKSSPTDLSSHRAKKLRRNRGEILAELNKVGARNPRIFGSVARGEDGKKSDIDILVDFDLKNDYWALVRAGDAIEKLLGEKVDLMPEAMLKANVLKIALKEGVPL